MRFNAKITAVLIAGVLACALLPSYEASAKSADTSTKQASSQTKKTEAAKKPEPKKVTVNPGDSLASIAEANQTDWVRIYNANESIVDPNIINPGDQLIIPTADEQLVDRYSQYAASVQPAAAAASSYTTRSYTSKPVNSSSYYVGNGMWCTDYVHTKRPDVPVYGNAGYGWISAAQAQGKATGATPRAGAVAVMSGHVAYVESVNADGSYVVSEMGWNYKAGSYNQRTVSPGTFGQFIY